MRYCSQCGEPLTDDASFCPECGTPVIKAPEEAAPAPQVYNEGTAAAPIQPAYTPAEPAAEPIGEPAAEPAPKKKKKVGKIIAICAAALLLLLIAAAAVLYFTGKYVDLLPAGRLKLGLAEKELVNKAVDDIYDAVPEWKDVHADIDITAGLTTNGTPSLFSEIGVIESIIGSADIQMKLDAAKEGFKTDIGVRYKGNTVLDAKLMKDGEKIGFYIPQLDDRYFTVTNEGLVRILSGEEGDTAAMSLLSELDLSMPDKEAARAEIMLLLEALSKLSTDQNTKVDGKVDAEIFNGKQVVSVARYTITPDEEQFKSAAYAAADVLAREDSVLGSKIGGIFKLINSNDEEQKDLPQAIRDWVDENAAEWVKEHTRIVILMDGNTIVSQSVLSDGLNFGYDRTESEEGDKTAVFSYGGNYENTYLELNEQPDQDTKRKGKLTMEADGENEFTLEYDFDKTEASAIGTYPGRVTLKAQDQADVDIVIEKSGDGMKHSIIVRPFDEYGDSEIAAVSIIANVREGGGVTAPDITPYDLSDKSPEEFQSILSGMVSQLSYVLLGMLF